MEPTQPNRGLLAAAQRLGRELGLTLEGAGLVGGASDANTTSRYTATLDGLGPVGEGAHAPDERVSVSSIAERAALLALLLLEPANRRSLSQAKRVVLGEKGSMNGIPSCFRRGLRPAEPDSGQASRLAGSCRKPKRVT
jgi:hypothetical protein